MPNRFSRRIKDPKFQPFSVEQYSLVPLTKQKEHNKALQSALAQQQRIDALPWHSKRRDELQDQLDTDIEGVVGEVQEKGVIQTPTTERIMELKQQKEDLFGQGSEGARIEQAAKNRGEFIKKLEDSDLPPGRQERALSYYDDRSKDLFDKDQIDYSGRLVSPEVDVSSKGRDIATQAPIKEIERQTNYRPNFQMGTFTNTKTGKTYRFADAVRGKEGSEASKHWNNMVDGFSGYITNQLLRDPEVTNYVQDEAMLRETDAEDIVKSLIEPTSREIASVFGGRQETTIDRSMKNMTKAQMFGNALEQRLSSPIFRPAGYFKNEKYNEEEINDLFNPTESLENKITNAEGDILNKQQFVDEIMKLKERGFTNMGAESLEDASEEELKTIASNYYNSRTKEEPVQDAVSKKVAGFQNLMGEIDLFNTEPLTKVEKQEMKQQVDQKLQPLMQQYNQSVSDSKKYQNVEQFKKAYMSDMKNEAEKVTKTVDYNVPSSDLVVKDIEDGNLDVLTGKSIRVVGPEGEEIEGSGEKTLDELQTILGKDPKVSSAKRIINGPKVGGRSFTINTKAGKTYQVLTESLSDNEKEMFYADKQVNDALYTPTFFGEGEPTIPTPHPNSEYPIVYYPTRNYQEGALSSGVKYHTINPKEYQKLRNEGASHEDAVQNSINSDVKNADLEEFRKLREQQRKPEYERMYKADYMLRKSQPNQ